MSSLVIGCIVKSPKHPAISWKYTDGSNVFSLLGDNKFEISFNANARSWNKTKIQINNKYYEINVQLFPSNLHSIIIIEVQL